MKQEFKAGDKVYYPNKQAQIYTLKERGSINYPLAIGDSINYPLVIESISSEPTFTPCGRIYMDDQLPSIFHATPENHELLCRLYGTEFEPPPKRKEPREIIKAMLKAGYDGVPCKTDCNKQYRFVCVNVSDDPYFPFVYDSLDKDDAFSSAIPYYYQTGKTIIDFVDGEIVTE